MLSACVVVAAVVLASVSSAGSPVGDLFLGSGTDNSGNGGLTVSLGKKIGDTGAPVLESPGGQKGTVGPVGGTFDPAVPKFKTVAEAEAWLLTRYGIEADFSAFLTAGQLAALRGIVSGLKDSIDLYPSTANITISSVKGDGSFCGQATSAPPGGKASIVFDVRGIMDVMSGQVATGGKNWRAYTWFDPRGMVAHEMGHIYSFSMADGGKAATHTVAASIATRAKAVPKTVLKTFPSVYSRTSDNEAFAEVFATTVNAKSKAYYTAKPAAAKQLAGVLSDYNMSASVVCLLSFESMPTRQAASSMRQIVRSGEIPEHTGVARCSRVLHAWVMRG